MFVVNTEAETDGLSDAGVGLYRLLNYIADEYDVSQALMSMVSVSRLWRDLSVNTGQWWPVVIRVATFLQLFNTLDVGGALSVETITEYMKRKFPKASAKRILGVESEYDDQRQVNSMYNRFHSDDILQADLHVLLALGWCALLQEKRTRRSTPGFI